MQLILRGKIFELTQPRVMGILNITKDSFYDGNKYLTSEQYLNQVSKMVEEGVDIIDIGAVSTKPGSAVSDPKNEWEILQPVIKSIQKYFPNIFLSIDTYHSYVAQMSLENGVDIINDITGGTYDSNILNVVATYKCPYILGHIQGMPNDMNSLEHTTYDNIIRDMLLYFEKQSNILKKLGHTQVIIDPGFGFSKTLDQNYLVLKNLDILKKFFPFPILGVSRKSMIYKLLNITPNDALNGTTALHAILLTQGVKILRVHDVIEAKQCVQLISKYYEVLN